MRFILDPTKGALIPYIIEKGQEAAQDVAANIVLHYIHTVGVWLSQFGVPLAAEGALIWGCVCLLISITGSGKWLERGVKSLIACLLLGMVKYAV